MNFERAKFTRRMPKFNRGREHRIISACCTWVTMLWIDFSNLQRFSLPTYLHVMTLKGIESTQCILICSLSWLQKICFSLKRRISFSNIICHYLFLKNESFIFTQDKIASFFTKKRWCHMILDTFISFVSQNTTVKRVKLTDRMPKSKNILLSQFKIFLSSII